MTKLYHHTFAPWTVADGTRVVASERAWSRVLKWDKDAFAAQREADREAMANTPMDCVPAMPMRLPRPRVLVGVDVFEDVDERIVDREGRAIYLVDGKFMTLKPGQFFLTPRDRATTDDVCNMVFSLIDQTPNIDWLIETVRPENIERMMPSAKCPLCKGRGGWETGPYSGGCPCENATVVRPNLWLGTSVTTKAEADERIPHLLNRRAPVRYVMLTPREEIDLSRWLSALNLVIVSGDTEPMHPDWVRSLRDQCQAAGVPFFFKQWGEWVPSTYIPDVVSRSNYRDETLMAWPWATRTGNDIGGDTTMMVRVGKKAAGRLLDGREWNELPEVGK